MTQQLSHVKQELPTIPEHLSLFVYCFVDRCLSFCSFYCGHCVFCPSIYGFWLPLWYFQTFLSFSYQSMLTLTLTTCWHMYWFAYK